VISVIKSSEVLDQIKIEVPLRLWSRFWC